MREDREEIHGKLNERVKTEPGSWKAKFLKLCKNSIALSLKIL